jgi:cell wall-associated NlpC family hydrolase
MSKNHDYKKTKRQVSVPAHKRYDPRIGKEVHVSAYSRPQEVRVYRDLTKEGKHDKDSEKQKCIYTPKELPPKLLTPGDWVLIRRHKKSIVPGDFDHCFMYCGKVQKNEQIWDRDQKEWMPPGTHYVIHSTIKSGNGLGYSSWDTIMGETKVALPLEAKNLSKTEKKECIDFLKHKLTGGADGKPVGPKYDIQWFSKQEDAQKFKGYYCSEAIWAAYKECHDIDLDPRGFNWSWIRAKGVAPEDLFESKNSTPIKKKQEK